MHLPKWYQKYIYSPVSLQDKTIKLESSKRINEPQQSTKLSKYFNNSFCNKTTTKLSFAVSDCLFYFYVHWNKSRTPQWEPGEYYLLSIVHHLFSVQNIRDVLHFKRNVSNTVITLFITIFLLNFYQLSPSFHHGVYCRIYPDWVLNIPASKLYLETQARWLRSFDKY